MLMQDNMVVVVFYIGRIQDSPSVLPSTSAGAETLARVWFSF